MTDTPSSTAHQTAVDIPVELRFLLELDALKDVERQNPLSSGTRRERVAEHSWHLAIAAILLRDSVDSNVDLGHAALLAVVHDVVESLVGDTFAFGDDTDGQYDREHAAMNSLRDKYDSKAIRRLIDIWEEYEQQESAEAKFVKGLDALLPIAQNYQNLEHSSWRRHGVTADRVYARLNNHGDVGKLRAVGEEMIASAKNQGFLA
jgi:putative hydrolase of HD superfamily